MNLNIDILLMYLNVLLAPSNHLTFLRVYKHSLKYLIMNFVAYLHILVLCISINSLTLPLLFIVGMKKAHYQKSCPLQFCYWKISPLILNSVCTNKFTAWNLTINWDFIVSCKCDYYVILLMIQLADKRVS